MAFAGKVRIAGSVATALSCPFFQGDSLHDTSAKAAGVGASRRPVIDGAGEGGSGSGVNEERYQRMWLSKLTRTGLLFPEESRPVVSNEGFSGFGGSSSTSTSRRGSGSSIASSSSDAAGSVVSVASSFMSSGPSAVAKFAFKPAPTFTLSDKEKERIGNKALLVVTHPRLEAWHKEAIRKGVGEYGIGVIFVPLGEEDEEEELPILKPLDPRTMTSFGDFGGRKRGRTLDEEIVVKVVGGGNVEDVIEDVVSGVRDIIDD